jgi:hypothetical protein
VVVLAAGGVAFFVFHKSSAGPPPIGPSNATSPLPSEANPVHFQLRSTSSVSTVTKKADQPQIQKAAQDIRDTLANMYTEAFTDPRTWKNGNYDNVFGFFALGKTDAAAKADAATLTLGTNAGDIYDDISPRYAAMVVKILTDKGGEPYTAAATTDFTADAKKKDGSNMVIKSHATYYLQRGEGGWVIVAYKAKRSDGGGNGGGHGGKPTPSATSGASQ